MKRKVKYTITTDPAIDRARLSVDQISATPALPHRKRWKFSASCANTSSSTNCLPDLRPVRRRRTREDV